jgi:hypothetical protein
MANQKTCFVVMGFGKKTDFQTGRVLDLDKSYHAIIKPAVLAAGLECRRADEFVLAGTIDTPMYEQLLIADVVVADVSTYNCNAFYELGVRHALRPFTTITIAEDKMTIPFDVNHVTVRRYQHMGDGIDYDEVIRMRECLQSAIETIAQTPKDDSPVYTFLNGLKPPVREIANAVAAASAGARPLSSAMPPSVVAASDQSATIVNLALQSHQLTQEQANCGAGAGTPENPTVSSLMASAQEAIDNSDFVAARAILQAVKKMAPRDSYVTQKLAMSTYKSAQPTPLEALREAVSILQELATDDSTDTETLGLWGAIHKRVWELLHNPADLDTALAAHQKAFVLKNDYWNGINLAYLYSERAALSTDPDEAEADRVMAKRARKKVLDICQPLYEANSLPTATHRYWLLATMAEAWLGLGEPIKVRQFLAEAAQQHPAKWMLDTTAEQMERLRKLP